LSYRPTRVVLNFKHTDYYAIESLKYARCTLYCSQKYIYIYIYIYREREREIERDAHTCVYVFPTELIEAYNLKITGVASVCGWLLYAEQSAVGTETMQFGRCSVETVCLLGAIIGKRLYTVHAAVTRPQRKTLLVKVEYVNMFCLYR